MKLQELVRATSQLKAAMVAAIRTEPNRDPGGVAVEAALDHGLRRAIWFSLSREERIHLVKDAIQEASK